MYLKNRFINYILRNKIDNKLYLLGFLFAIIAYSLWKPLEDMLGFVEENEGSVYFLCIAMSFFCYTSAYLFTKWNSWRFFPMFVALICVTRVLNEIYFMAYPENNPEEYNIFDYINFLITVWVVFNYYVKHQQTLYKELKKNNLKK
jgi:hypothetical protein